MGSGATLTRPAFEPSAAAAQSAIDFQPSNTLGPVARYVVVAASADAHPFAGGRQRVAVMRWALGEAFQDGNDTPVERVELIIDIIAVRGVAWWFSWSPIHQFRIGKSVVGD